MSGPVRAFVVRLWSRLQSRPVDIIIDEQFTNPPKEHPLRYLRKKGMGKHRRGSNSESGMRLLRRLEKNHDGIRSAATRQHYIQIYQAMKDLSLDIAAFIDNWLRVLQLPLTSCSL